jgi:transposase
MDAYSEDLRERVMAACDEGSQTIKQVAAMFQVSVAWIHKLRKRRRDHHSIAALPRGHGPEPKLGDKHRQRLGELVREDPDATLEQLRERLRVEVSLSTVWRALARLGITFKKSRSTRANATDRMSWPIAKSSANASPRSTRKI